MRTPAALAASLLLVLPAGCSDDATATPAGCGLVPDSKVVGLVGADPHATLHGSLHALRGRHRALSCRSVSPDDATRSVLLRASYHPKPYRLPQKACSDGWVYAGTPEKFTPACQQRHRDRSTTELVVRWQPYLMTVTISRPDRGWGGDPERALALTRALAQRLGVAEAAGDG